MWKTASKAGQPGILACIPIVQLFILMMIAKKPLWWVLLFFVPFVNIIVVVIVLNEISNRFGRGVGTTLGLIFLPFIFWPILGFGDAEYQH
ncbi:MAG TPA: signal peptidase I [Phycisphaerales bacterium]|nr:signal peptidase I [Phycisphaerales bacterium]HIB01079.1 signal peptidase I [Phycisphaerales bacterium]HIB49742.1 signal peptidase I [Phycisphaerales bacterium]HIN84261.1 signal peptidase I [Phycisphaerales bacterium]HIO52972.1 signal peptidase I [Phycisphaerales bacterium]